jgi:hypothetical protein
VHDFYRRFIKKDGTETHYVNVGRISTILLYLVAAGLSYVLTSAQQAFEVLLSVGAGTGSLYVIRWYWHRVNAWAEVVAMVSSIAVTGMFVLCGKFGPDVGGVVLAAIGALVLLLGVATDAVYKPELSFRVAAGYALPFIPVALVAVSKIPGEPVYLVLAFIALGFAVRRLFVSDVAGEPTLHTSLRLAGLLLIAAGLLVTGLNAVGASDTLLAGGFAHRTIWTVALTTISWIVACFVAPATDKATLIAFVRKVKPAGPGWSALRAEAGVNDSDTASSNHTVLSFVGWASGVATIWSSLFAIGNFLYAAGDPSRLTMAWVLTAIFVVSGLVLLNVIQRLWAKPVEA